MDNNYYILVGKNKMGKNLYFSLNSNSFISENFNQATKFFNLNKAKNVLKESKFSTYFSLLNNNCSILEIEKGFLIVNTFKLKKNDENKIKNLILS